MTAANRQHDKKCQAEFLLKQQAHFDDGVLPRHLPRNEYRKGNGRDDSEGHDEIGLKPVIFLALVENDIEAAEEQRDQYKSDPVDLQSAGQTLFPLLFQNSRFGDQPVHKENRDDADGDIDEEYPVPGEIVGNPPAERRTDGWRHNHGTP
jgi:hypothetical protein